MGAMERSKELKESTPPEGRKESEFSLVMVSIVGRPRLGEAERTRSELVGWVED
jgi:hypothetical protein